MEPLTLLIKYLREELRAIKIEKENIDYILRLELDEIERTNWLYRKTYLKTQFEVISQEIVVAKLILKNATSQKRNKYPYKFLGTIHHG